MEAFQTIAAILGLTAMFSFLNERWLGLQQTIGLMVIALVFTLALGLLNAFGFTSLFVQEQAFVSRLKLDATLLNGVLCFILFAGSINVKARSLGEEKWIILSLAIGATLIAAVLIGVALWALLAAFGAGLGLIYALVFGAFMREHFDRFFLLYLAVPLALALGAAAFRVAEARRSGEPIGPPLRAGLTLFASFAGLSAVFVLWYFGIGPALDYAAEQAKLLSSLRYAERLPSLGEPGHRIGFNEWYWLQLPWLVTAVFAVWWTTAARRNFAAAVKDYADARGTELVMIGDADELGQAEIDYSKLHSAVGLTIQINHFGALKLPMDFGIGIYSLCLQLL